MKETRKQKLTREQRHLLQTKGHVVDTSNWILDKVTQYKGKKPVYHFIKISDLGTPVGRRDIPGD